MMQFLIRGLIGGGLLFCGFCKKEGKVTSYQIPKEESKAAIVQNQASTNKTMEQAIARSLKTEASTIVAPNWVAPVGWGVLPSDALKKGNFQVKDEEGHCVEITVIGLQGYAGGELANINRWRQQVGLGPLLDVSAVNSLEVVKVDGRAARLIDVEGSEKSIYGAMFARDKESWFFKMMGDSAIVKKEKENFLKFLESVEFADTKNAG